MGHNADRMNPDTYMKERVDDQLRYYERAAGKAKRKHIWTQTLIIVFGLVVPVLVNIDEGAEYLRWVITALSLAVAVLTGLYNFRKYGDLWLTFRLTEETLKHQKFLFLTGAEPYDDKETAFKTFVHTIESTISTEHQKFRQLIEQARRPVAQKENK